MNRYKEIVSWGQFPPPPLPSQNPEFIYDDEEQNKRLIELVNNYMRDKNTLPASQSGNIFSNIYEWLEDVGAAAHDVINPYKQDTPWDERNRTPELNLTPETTREGKTAFGRAVFSLRDTIPRRSAFYQDPNRFNPLDTKWQGGQHAVPAEKPPTLPSQQIAQRQKVTTPVKAEETKPGRMPPEARKAADELMAAGWGRDPFTPPDKGKYAKHKDLTESKNILGYTLDGNKPVHEGKEDSYSGYVEVMDSETNERKRVYLPKKQEFEEGGGKSKSYEPALFEGDSPGVVFMNSLVKQLGFNPAFLDIEELYKKNFQKAKRQISISELNALGGEWGLWKRVQANTNTMVNAGTKFFYDSTNRFHNDIKEQRLQKKAEQKEVIEQQKEQRSLAKDYYKAINDAIKQWQSENELLPEAQKNRAALSQQLAGIRRTYEGLGLDANDADKKLGIQSGGYGNRTPISAFDPHAKNRSK